MTKFSFKRRKISNIDAIVTADLDYLKDPQLKDGKSENDRSLSSESGGVLRKSLTEGSNERKLMDQRNETVVAEHAKQSVMSMQFLEQQKLFFEVILQQA